MKPPFLRLRRVRGPLRIAVAVLAVLGALPARAQTAPTVTLTFPAVADTYVDSSSASANFGAAKTLLVGASPVRISYFRFAVTGVSGRPVLAARLKLGVKTGGTRGGSVHRITNTAWSETAVTYKTRPAVDGPALTTLATVATGATVTFDLGTAVAGDGAVSLALDATGSAVTYNATQATAGQKPVLEVVVALAPPTVTIVQPPGGASFFVGDAVTLQGSAHDDAGVDLGGALAWTDDVAGTLGRGALVTTRALGAGPHTITAAATGSNGLTGASRTSITVLPVPPTNTAPLVAITAPTAGQLLDPRVPATLVATAYDLEDGNLTSTILWTSDRDGVLGPTGLLSRRLSPGTHQITAWATDRAGLTSTATVTVDVGVAMEFTPVADASVDSTAPGVNAGTSPLLRVDANPVRIAYLRFDVSGIGTAPVLRTRLRLQVDGASGADSDSGGVLHAVADTSWAESALTFDARPLANGPLLATAGAVRLGQAVDFDLGTAVPGDGSYAFALGTNSLDEVDYRSREGGPAPKLVVIVAGKPPVVAIAAPADGTIALQGSPVTFGARATSGALDLSDRLRWTSSRDGLLGAGATVTASALSVGTHAITASATDDAGLRGQAQETVRVRGPNQAPVVTIAGPAAGTSVPAGTPVGLDATAVDEWDGDLTARIQWRDDRDGALGSGGARIVALSEGSHALTASVTDSDGATGSAQTQVGVTPTAPVVGITTPAEGATFFVPATVAFAGTAVDATDGNLGAALRWTSDRDGPIGTGATFSTARLSLGTHVVTASVGDRGGLVGQARRTIVVRRPNVTPAVAIAAPVAGARLLAGARTVLAASAIDPEDGDLGDAVRWTSSVDGPLGTGALLVIPGLSAGAHVLTAAATDRDGATTSATVAVTVVPAVVTFGAVADTYVDGGSTSAKFGTATTLWIDASPVRQAFLRFAPSGLAGFAVQQAHLRLTAATTSTAASPVGGTLATLTSTTWSESTTTYKNRPAIDGAVLGVQGAVAAGQVVDFDVGAVVRGDGTYGFALTSTSKDEAVYASREAATGKPQLVVTLAQDTAPAVRITRPVPGTVVPVGASVTLAAVATDAESGDLGAAIRWSSSRDGVLGTGPSLTIRPGTGVHTLTASVADAGGRTGTATTTLIVDTPPTVAITVPASGIVVDPGVPLLLSATAADAEDGDVGARVVWSSSRDGVLGTGATLTTSALGSGTHTLTAAVTDAAGLGAQASATVVVDALPVVTIGSPAAGASLEPGTPLTLAGAATDAEDGDLGAALVWTSSRDGVLGTGARVAVAGLTSGTHVVTATATDASGRSGRATVTVVVNATPAVTITAPATGTTVVAGRALALAATATDVEDGDLGRALAWTSDRDGALGTGATLTTTTLTPGTHVLAASATDRGGKIGRATITVVVLPNAVPAVTILTPADGTYLDPGVPVALGALATDAEDGDLGTAVTWTSSRDGALGTGASVNVPRLTAGTHVLTARVVDSGGKPASAAVGVIVDAVPVLHIVAPASRLLVAPGAPVALVATASDAEDGDVTGAIAWTSDRDGPIGRGGSVSATPSTGAHVVTASVTDSAGRTSRASIAVTIDAPPAVTIAAPAAGMIVAPGAPLTLAATATDAEDGDLSGALAWSSSRDGTLGTGGALTTAALSAGTHVVTATVTDHAGQTATASTTVTVSAPPTVAITAPPAGGVFAPGDPIAFTAEASDAEDGDLADAVAWTSSRDGALGTGGRLTVASLRSGTHEITASVTDASGQRATSTVRVTVDAAPHLAIVAPDPEAVVDPALTLLATASDLEDGDLGSAIAWTSSRDGALGTGGTLAVRLSPGPHDLTASVSDAAGRTASATIPVVVDAPPVVTIDAPTSGATFEPGARVELAASATDPEDGDVAGALVWTSDLDGALGGGSPLTVVGLRSGTHAIEAAVADAAGRRASARVTVVVNATPIVRIDAPADGTLAGPGDPVHLAATATDAEDGDLSAAVVWTSSLDGPLGSGLLDVGLVHSGAHVLTATVTDRGGKTAQATRTVVVDAAPVLRIDAPADGAVAAPADPVALVAAASDREDGDLGSGIAWTSDLDGPLGTGAALTVSGLRAGLHHLTATVADAAGRMATATRTLLVDTAPTVGITSPADGAVYDTGAAVAFVASAADVEDGDLGAAVVWSSDLDGVVAGGATAAVASLRPGVHRLTAGVMDAAGRSARASVTITVDTAPTVTIGAPAAGSTYHPRDPVTLSATASDPEDGDLSRAIAWTSSRDGALGSGATLTTSTLSPGTHVLTAASTDAGGRTGRATTTVVVGPLYTLRGPQAGAFTKTLALDALVDAVGATFFPAPSNLYPVNLDGDVGAILRGGSILGQYDHALTWDDMHNMNNAGVVFGNAGFTVDGVRIDDVTDGIRPKSGGGFTVRNVWGSWIRDDCIENDHLQDGVVDDTLFDGCYEGFSARPSQAIIDSGYSGRGKVWTIQRTLVRLQPMPDPPQGTADGLGTNTFFKWHKWTDPANSLSPKLSLHDDVFMAERVGLAGGTRMGVPPGMIDSCSNNVIVWLGPGTFPGVLPPGCFTITTDRRVWDDAVADWHARHPDVGR